MKNRFLIEAITGLVVLVALIIFAVWLLIRKEAGPREGVDVIQSEITADSEGAASDDTNLNGDIAISIDKTTEASVTDKGVLGTSSSGSVSQNTSPGDAIELPQTYTAGKMVKYTKDNTQMPELYKYWDEYNLEAVSDLINLDRVRKITDSLKGTNDYYYYGGGNSDGLPEGKGLAIYADNTYYFGEWHDGLRHGTGMWLRIYPDSPGTVNGVKGVTWHQYSGQWMGDYPNGEGQEHISYAEDAKVPVYAIHNAIGCFANGYYIGNMYIMSDNGDGSTTDWYASAKDGVFEYLSEKINVSGKKPIWKAGDGYETGEEDNCRWIDPKYNSDFGIAGLKKGR